jgi:hypothetical protein
MNLNSEIDTFLKKTLWIWLPFYALLLLIKELREYSSKR